MYDVVIAGGGPVGVFLACELRLAGVSVLVLERTKSPSSPLKAGWMGMRGLNFASAEAFYRRGMLEDVRTMALGWIGASVKAGIESWNTDKQPSQRRFGGHFAGIMIDMAQVDLSDQKYVVDGPSASGGMVSLEDIETILSERAVKLGVDLRYGTAVTGFVENADSVSVHAGDECFRGSWLVGCDGGRSVVRKLAKFEFSGTEPEFTGYSAAAKLVDAEKLKPGFNLTEHGMYLLGPGPDRLGLIEFDNAAFDRKEQVSQEVLQAALRRVSGTDVTIASMTVASTYTDRARQATTYRKGRVLLAGDAAHVHSPLGGQGLNTGIGDAMNLGWKLAATIKGWASEGLLDSYTTERHPIDEWALNWTRAQVAIMRPDPHARAIASIIRDLIQTGDAATYFVGKMSGMMMRYDLGGEHPLIGRSAPDFEFEDGVRLGDYLRDGRGVLLELDGQKRLLRAAEGRQDRLNYLCLKAKDNKGVAALLVRPDGFVAWATDGDYLPDAVTSGLDRWFGYQ